MYRIIVVDDEPIILSGIRHLIDWEKEDAEIIGVARNGAEAFREVLVSNTPVSSTDGEHLRDHTKKSNLKSSTGVFQQDIGYDKETGWRAHFPNSGTVKQKPQHFIEKSREQAVGKVRREFIEALKV